MKNIRPSLVTCLFFLAFFGDARAAEPETAYLKPAAYSAAPGQSIQIRFTRGTAARSQAVPWPTERIDWLFVRAAGGQENRENVGPRDAASDFIEVAATTPGVALIGLDAKPVVQSWAIQDLQDFCRRTLTTDAYQALVAQTKQKTELKIRRVESAKTLVRVGDADGKSAAPSSVAQSKTGQMVELRAMTDPTLVPVGGDLPVRTYVGYDALGGQKVLATCVATGKTHEAVCDKSGFAAFRIDSTGEWRIEFHALQKPQEGEAVDAVLYSATLTFEVTRREGGK